MVKGIETLAQNLPIPPDQDSQTIHAKNLIIATNTIDVKTTDDLTVDFRRASPSTGQTTTDTQETFKLPMELIHSLARRGEKQQKLGTVLYTTSKFFSSTGPKNKDSNTSSYLNSRIISASISGMKVQNLAEPVVMTYDVLQEDSNGVPECVFWDFNALGNVSRIRCVYVGNQKVITTSNRKSEKIIERH